MDNVEQKWQVWMCCVRKTCNNITCGWVFIFYRNISTYNWSSTQVDIYFKTNPVTNAMAAVTGIVAGQKWNQGPYSFQSCTIQNINKNPKPKNVLKLINCNFYLFMIAHKVWTDLFLNTDTLYLYMYWLCMYIALTPVPINLLMNLFNLKVNTKIDNTGLSEPSNAPKAWWLQLYSYGVR